MIRPLMISSHLLYGKLQLVLCRFYKLPTFDLVLADKFFAWRWSFSLLMIMYLPTLYTNCRFIYTFLGIGVSFCLIAGLGHVAADSANGFCLSCVSFLNNFKQKLYIKPFFISVETLKWIFEIFVDLERTKYVVVIFLLLLLESAMVADILLNSDWEKASLTSFAQEL